jgi:hypothetical protein
VKGAAALLALLVAGMIAAFVVAVRHSRDTVPNDIRACLADSAAHLIQGPEGLAFARQDIEHGRMRTIRRYKLGRDRGVLLGGDGYSVLVVATHASPPLGGDLAQRVYLRTSEYAVVATEQAPVRGVLDGCARKRVA